MKRFSQRFGGQNTMAELNITPLLDLAFVLLIIFIITTPVMEQGINVSTPSSSPSQLAIDPKNVRTITVDAAGKLYLDQEMLSTNELDVRLVALKTGNPEVAVGIRADKSLSYDKVVAVLDALQRAGITRCGLITKAE